LNFLAKAGSTEKRNARHMGDDGDISIWS
jgi:hypothetical protein